MEGLESDVVLENPTNNGVRCRDCEQHLREAQVLQVSLLPSAPLAEHSFEFAFRYSPFFEVSGDFADFFRLPNGFVGLYMGDVVGKGLPAALYGALVMGALRGIHKTGTATARVLSLLNERLLQRPMTGRFCSTLYAVFDPITRTLQFSNAGLPRPLLVSKSSCQPLGEGGLPSGMFPNATYEEHTAQLFPGDSVLFATDGVHELCNAEGIEFGEGKILETWDRCRHRSAGESLEYLFESLKQFSSRAGQHDDVTVVVLRVPQ